MNPRLARLMLRGVGLLVAPVNRLLRRVLPVPRVDLTTWTPHRSAGVPALRIVLLTDVHLGPTSRPGALARVAARVNELAPDVVLLGGDYFFRAIDEYVEEFVAAVAALRARLGVFAVLGNHDHWLNPGLVRRSLDRGGARLLDNAGVRLGDEQNTLWLCGIDDVWAGAPDLAAALAGRRTGESCVLLSHNPDIAAAAADAGVDLVLSGHTHGGQIRLAGRTLFSNSRFGDEHLAGRSAVADTAVHVSRGVGTVEIALRLGAPAEISVIDVGVVPATTRLLA